MRRIAIPARADWQARVAELGFDYHTIGGVPYWIEDACYELTEREVDTLEDATAELHAMCLDAMDRVVRGALWGGFGFDERAIALIERSWRTSDPALYGRMDFSWDGTGAPKLLEYNADTPTALFEASVVQWFWVEERGGGDQFNSIHERLISRWPQVLVRRPARVHFASFLDDPEDAATADYLRDTCIQAGFATERLHVEDIGWDGRRFFDDRRAGIECAFKLYPWAWMFREDFAPHLATAATRWIEPPWKAVLADKAILPLLWRFNTGHPNLLPASLRAADLSGRIVRKPCDGREGEGVEFLDAAGAAQHEGRVVYQAAAELPRFDGWHPVIGSWVVGHDPAGVGVREDSGLVTRNTSRFVPHRIA
jgi:glutathionylspermidine synthase